MGSYLHLGDLEEVNSKDLSYSIKYIIHNYILHAEINETDYKTYYSTYHNSQVTEISDKFISLVVEVMNETVIGNEYVIDHLLYTNHQWYKFHGEREGHYVRWRHKVTQDLIEIRDIFVRVLCKMVRQDIKNIICYYA